MCPHKGSVTLVLERAENLGRGLFPLSPQFSQMLLATNRPQQKQAIKGNFEN